MNSINGFVTKVIKETIRESADMWDLEPGEENKTFYIYTVEAVDEGGPFQTSLYFNEPQEIKEGYKFIH